MRILETMSELRVQEAVDAASWNESLRACDGTVFHTPEWARYVQTEQPAVMPEFVTLVDDDGSAAGHALVFRSSSRRFLAGALTRRRWMDALPAVKGNSTETVSRFVQLLERRARESGDVTLQIGSYASPDSTALFDSLGFSITRRLEFELDLTRDVESLWESFETRRRRNIKKAMKANVEVRELEPHEGVSHLRRLQRASFERIVEKGGPEYVPPAAERPDPILALTGAGLGRLVGGFVDGECVSASFFSTFNGIAYDALLGHDARAFETQAPSLVIWEMLQRFKREGFRRLSLGGCPADASEESSPEHGVYVYKTTFGGTVVHCTSGEKILRPAVQKATGLLRAAIG